MKKPDPSDYGLNYDPLTEFEPEMNCNDCIEARRDDGSARCTECAERRDSYLRDYRKALAVMLLLVLSILSYFDDFDIDGAECVIYTCTMIA